MAELHPRPLIIDAARRAMLLERVALDGSASGATYSEDWLQDLLYRFPQALPVGEIDESFAGLVAVCREMNTPAGPIDVLYATPSGRLAVVEAKLWRNPEARRKVIGQILDYAKELSRWTYETLDAAVRSARRSEATKALFEVVREHAPDTNERDFVDAVYRSLRRGEFLLLIVGDGIREGVGAITEFLEGHGTLHFTFGLVEMTIYRLPDGGLLVQPRVLTQSSIVRRFVVTLNGSVLAAEESSTASGEQASEEINPDLERERSKFQGFWAEFSRVVSADVVYEAKPRIS